MQLRLPQSRQQGFTLIELMITLLIFGILLSLAGPPFQAWVRGTQLRTYAESFQSAVQLARAEAIKRNTYVELILTNGSVAPVNSYINSVTESTSGSAWLIRACPDCVNLTTKPSKTDASYPFIEGKTVAEGSSSRFKLLADQSLLRFDGLGRADKTLSLIVSANDSNVSDCTDTPKGNVVQNPARVCLLVDEGGNTRLCLPDAPKENPSSCLR